MRASIAASGSGATLGVARKIVVCCDGTGNTGSALGVTTSSSC